MDLASLLKFAIVASIVFIVLSIGLAAPPGAIRAGFGKPMNIARAMVAMFLFFPMFALAVTWIIPLDPAARIALLALAVSPMPPILPIKEQKLGGELDYALAIQLAASLVALAAAPLAYFSGSSFSFSVSGGRFQARPGQPRTSPSLSPKRCLSRNKPASRPGQVGVRSASHLTCFC
jgi:BASS family bile acid:Na+ symporter